MRSCYLYLLIYLLMNWLGQSGAERNDTCTAKEACSERWDPTSNFLHCVGLPEGDTGRDHMRRLKDMLEATMDLYTFMKSSMTGVPFLTLQGQLELDHDADPLQNEALVQMWLDVKVTPLLKSITKGFLTCLSTKNFSCSTYQTVVKELSRYYSGMKPYRQKWIYTFFMYPFLSGERVDGCVNPHESNEEWLIKNFGSFRAMARLKDFSTLNLIFSGLEVLHLLSPAQTAELLMSPEFESLDNGTLTLVFNNLLTGGSGPRPTPKPDDGRNWTSPGFPSTYQLKPMSPQTNMREVVNGFTVAFRSIGSFAHEFVSFTSKRNVSEIKSTTLTQFVLNWTLSELADMYRPPKPPVVPERPKFDVTNVEDWYKQVVIPLLQRFLPDSDHLTDEKVVLAFHQAFYLEHGMENETFEIQDVCSISIDKSPCGLTNVVENVAKIMHCAAKTKLTINDATIMRMIDALTKRLNLLIMELSKANFRELAADFHQIFSEADPPSLTQEHLSDTDFIELWFKTKLMPTLPDVPPDLLSCLSTKNFSCPVYQTIVGELSEQMSMMDVDPMYSHNIYKHFIYSFLLQHNTSEPRCAVNNSKVWLRKNFGFFSQFAVVTDFYELNQNFSGLEVLPYLSPKQLAQMMVLPLPAPPEKHVVINRVFDFLETDPVILPEVLHHLGPLAKKVNPPCSVYRHILKRLYTVIPSLHPDMEPDVWAGIDELMSIAPEGCVPDNLTCPATTFNASFICRGIHSSELESHFHSMAVPCNFTLETYACAQLENFTASQLVSLLKCTLPGNSSHSKMLWKMVLTKVSFILEPALDIIAKTPNAMLGPSASEVLDVLGEMRVSLLTDEQLMNSSEIRKWFSGRLSAFLPSASGRFLHCLSQRNLSCQSYQHILQVFIRQFDHMSVKQKNVVVMSFIVPFLSRPDTTCVNGSNSTADWLMKNLGPFSMLLPLKELLLLNPHFTPLENLGLLTPNQSAELLVLRDPTLPEKDVIINMLFDHLTEPTQQHKLPEFLSHLVMLLPRANLSCSSYKALFSRLDLATIQVPLAIAMNISLSKADLSKYLPPACIIYRGNCSVTMTNETDICIGVNSTALQLHLDGGNREMCDFAVEEFACASLSALTAQDVAAMLMCNRTSNSSGSTAVWKLLFSKTSHVLDEALDLLANKTLDPTNPALPIILQAIREVRLDTFNLASLNDPAFIQRWFNGRLRPFLPHASPDFLSCVATKGLNCTTYQHIVKILSHVQPQMSLSTQMFVYTHFIKVFLSRNLTADPSCSFNTNNSGDWLQKNLGAFSVLVSFHELQMLRSNFSAMEALPHLTVRQLAEVAATPDQLRSPAQAVMVMNHVPDQHLPDFYDAYSPAIMGSEHMFPSPVRSAMLQVVFDRANLADHSVSDSEVRTWLLKRMRPLLFDLSPRHAAPFFKMLAGRNCSLEQQGVEELNSTMSSLSDETKKEVHNEIIQQIRGPAPLRCYIDSHNQSFYVFLERSFMGFQFPNLTTMLLLMPHDRMPQLVNSMTLSDLGDFLRRPDVVDDDAQLCVLYDNYQQTPDFLDTVEIPAAVRRPTLPCVWPMALKSSERSEVNAWFDRRLHNYMGFLTRDLISPSVTYNSSCVAFQKLVSVLGEYNYTTMDFSNPDVFDSIRTYLTSATVPRCYNSSDPELNSTAWFAEYIGPFMPFLTLEDLLKFGSSEVIQVFTVNPLNIALLNHSSLPLNLTNYYTQLIYLQDSGFNPLLLPLVSRCVAPGPAFSQLNEQETMIMLYNLTTLCTDLDPQVSAALAGNLGDTVDATAIAALGSESSGLSTGQIETIRPDELVNSLHILSAVGGWNRGQARAIVASMMSSGSFEIADSSSLLSLGSLLVGVPASVFGKINGLQLVDASGNPGFRAHLMSAPQVVQAVFVKQIISVNSNSKAIIENVPVEMATEIPRDKLPGVPRSVIKKLNKMTWKKQQVELFFDVIAAENATTELGGANNLSSSVLQGFTCTAVRTITKVQKKKLVKACRRKKTRKVVLSETQLTCMYNIIKGDSDASSFQLYPADMLLYYDYSLVSPDTCRSYFEQISDADFSVFSRALSYKRTNLISNARSCLGITGTTLTQDNINVLGNMCCYLDPSYIENSDPSILEKLKTCSDLTGGQASAVQTRLLSGGTQYGDPSTWTEQTLQDLGMLPLYMTSEFYDQFDRKTKRGFLKFFKKVMRSNGVNRRKRKKLRREIRKSLRKKSKRSIAAECTVGTITRVTISDGTFPFDYDEVAQFNCCLSATTVKDNLAAIAAEVEEEEYLQIVLNKLHEAYASSSSIPEDQVQVLGPVSRVANVDQINMWTITLIDTLSALMNPSDGDWDPSMANAVISNYLSTSGNELGSLELNSIGGTYLCSLDVDVLKNISSQSLKEADALLVSNCTADQKQALFATANKAFSSTSRSSVSVSDYQLIRSYIGGANLTYVQSLASSNVNMDMTTFTSLDNAVVQALSVDEVKNLLGSNVDELKNYENQTMVQAWIRSQYQSSLDTLGLNLTGGRADPTTTTTTTTTSSSAGTQGGAATAAPGTTTTTGGGSRVGADVGLSLLLLLSVLFITSQHIVL